MGNGAFSAGSYRDVIRHSRGSARSGPRILRTAPAVLVLAASLLFACGDGSDSARTPEPDDARTGESAGERAPQRRDESPPSPDATSPGDAETTPTGSGDAPKEEAAEPAAVGGITPAGRWEALSPLAAGPRQETAVVALAGEIYVLGGFDRGRNIVATVEAYDPATERWRTVAPLPLPLHHANTAAVNGRLYVVGFLTGGAFSADGRAFEYDPDADSWSARAAMPAGTERGGAGVAVLGGKIYVAGGFRSGAVGDFSAYDPAMDSWEILPDVPAPRDHLVAGAIGGMVFVAGGRGGTIATVDGRMDAFDPDTRTWSSRAPMPTPRGGIAAAVLNGRLYVFGGEGSRADASGVFDEVEAYDPTADAWKTFPAMPTPRHGTGAVPLAGRIYVPGGAIAQGFGAVATNERFMP